MERRRLGTWAAGIAGVVLATGCLFPSFDPLRGSAEDTRRDAEPEDEDEDGGTPADARPRGDAGPARDAASDRDPVVVGDTGTDAPLPSGSVNQIRCDDAICVVGSTFCCVGVLPRECEEEPRIDECVVATRYRCDGTEDCPGGQVCCHDGSDLVMCRATCSGAILCRDSAQCPAPQQCTRTLEDGFKACQ